MLLNKITILNKNAFHAQQYSRICLCVRDWLELLLYFMCFYWFTVYKFESCITSNFIPRLCMDNLILILILPSLLYIEMHYPLILHYTRGCHSHPSSPSIVVHSEKEVSQSPWNVVLPRNQSTKKQMVSIMQFNTSNSWVQI